MKLIIAGSRSFFDYDKLEDIMAHDVLPFFPIIEIVSGTAKGADHLGEIYAQNHKIILKKFPADWKAFGKAAGPIRNEQMANYADMVLALWDGESRGTQHMVKTMLKLQKTAIVYNSKTNIVSVNHF